MQMPVAEAGGFRLEVWADSWGLGPPRNDKLRWQRWNWTRLALEGCFSLASCIKPWH